MARKKKNYKYFQTGDVIMTTPELGFYGVAVVFDVAKEDFDDLMCCHNAITPLLFKKEITMEDLKGMELKPFVKRNYAALGGDIETITGYFDKITIDIYPQFYEHDFQIIGKIDPKLIYDGELVMRPSTHRFHLCGMTHSMLDREAFLAKYYKLIDRKLCKVMDEE